MQIQASKFGRLTIEEEGGDYRGTRQAGSKNFEIVRKHKIKEEVTRWNSHLKKRKEWIELGGRFSSWPLARSSSASLQCKLMDSFQLEEASS